MEIAQQNEIDPEIEKIYSDLESEVDFKIRSFWSQKQNEIEKSIKSMANQSFGPTYRKPSTSKQVGQTVPTAAVPAQTKSLPWFAGGIKGFLRKLWHGDSASNPDWKFNTVKESFSINEYFFIKSEIENILFETEMLQNDEIKNLVSSIMISIKIAVEKTKKYMINKPNDSGYKLKNKRKYERKTGTVETEPAESIPEPEPTVNQAPESTKEPEPSESIPEPAQEPELVQEPAAPQQTTKNKVGNLNKSKRNRKTEKQNFTPNISFDEMKLDNDKVIELAKNLNNIVNDELSQYMGGGPLTTKERQVKKEIEQQIIKMLSDNGIEMTGKGYVASTEANAVKLVQILKELGGIESFYNWTDVESYHGALPGMLSKNTDDLIEKTIKTFKQKQSEDDLAEPANESFNKYLNDKNKLSIKEKRDLFKNLIKENDSYYVDRIALNRIKDKKEKIEFIKNLIHC